MIKLVEHYKRKPAPQATAECPYIAGKDDSTAALAVKAYEWGSILQSKGAHQIIYPVLLKGYTRVHVYYRPDSPEAA
ncbi:hypothetical protein [Methylovorus glucosotrophus]|uniref:Uncharacterized protein n=1 Tax=Methylovorus glucosotrophus (strain SIP3-4) TaxID=582744 RepID=C6XEC5_METGS|nr:hypothetical protein [Methylovorus glucosotrophus]ACT50900.1 hypothetical protein Msip34_1655 [Methylovorus glucosotrophus SIP3-4]